MGAILEKSVSLNTLMIRFLSKSCEVTREVQRLEE